jgi:hypothetical protein
MGMKLQWRVLRSDLPAHLKPLALVLALIAKDDGSGLWVRVEKLAGYLGLHRTTVSRQLEELRTRGVLSTERRSGRTRATTRRLNADALGLRSAHATESRTPTRSAHATEPVDCVAPTLRDARDCVAPTLPINPIKRTKPLTNTGKPSVRPHDGAENAPRATVVVLDDEEDFFS